MISCSCAPFECRQDWDASGLVGAMDKYRAGKYVSDAELAEKANVLKKFLKLPVARQTSVFLCDFPAYPCELLLSLITERKVNGASIR